MFPYTCEECGGSYMRCGYDKCVTKNCSGGQFCYEDNVVILVNGKRYDGVYDGYGQVYVSSIKDKKDKSISSHRDSESTERTIIYIPTEFNEYIDK